MIDDLILFLFWQHEGEAKKVIFSHITPNIGGAANVFC